MIPSQQKVLTEIKKVNIFVNSEVYVILLHENQKLSVEQESQENIEAYFDENKLSHFDNMSLYDTK